MLRFLLLRDTWLTCWDCLNPASACGSESVAVLFVSERSWCRCRLCGSSARRDATRGRWWWWWRRFWTVDLHKRIEKGKAKDQQRRTRGSKTFATILFRRKLRLRKTGNVRYDQA